MLPDQAGTYVLILDLPRPTTINIGRLGRFAFPAGRYAYAGSARGPGGLAARVSRHLRSSKPRHWHIDYLRAEAAPVAIWYAVGSQRRECAWATALADLPRATIPVPHFGASDCHCVAHLVYFGAVRAGAMTTPREEGTAPPDLETFVRAVGEPISQERLHV
jgi:Uri superfamily endonuclease